MSGTDTIAEVNTLGLAGLVAARMGSGPRSGTPSPRTVQPDRAAITVHLRQLHELAKAAGVIGKLVLASYGEDPMTGRAIPPKVEHYNLGNVEGMVEQALWWTVEPNRNVYAPLVVMRPDLPRGKKGGEGDIVCVLGLTGDFDDADAENWGSRSLLPPSHVLETSPGRFQTFVWFDPAGPVGIAEAKALAVQLQGHAHCDFGSKDLSHVWRISGTLNWPNKKKLDDGRSPIPQMVVMVTGGTGRTIDTKSLPAAVATPPVIVTPVVETARHGRGAVLPRKTRLAPPDAIPDSLKDELEGRSKESDRSTLFFKVVNELDRLGYRDVMIAEMLAQNPHVTPERYHDRMLTEVRACIQKGTDPVIESINARFAEIIDRGQSVFVTESIDSRTGMRETYVLSLVQLRDRLASEPVPRNANGKARADNMADYWRKHPHHRCYEGGFVLKPDKQAAVDEFNLWKGYGVEPDSLADDTLILCYLREVVCQNNAALFEKVLCLLAYMVQHLGEPWTIALVLAGGQGTGKTTLAMIFKRIFGTHHRTEDTLEDLFVTFNSGLLSKVFVSVEEGASGARQDVWARFKPFITRPDLSINEKYRPSITVPNTAHVLVTTNKPELLKVDHDDRRLWILTVEERWTKGQFKTLYGQIADGRACGKFLYRLQHHTIHDFDPQRDRPLTMALAVSKERSFSAEESILREWLQDGRLGTFGTFGRDGLRMSRKATFAAYETDMQRAYRGQKPLGRNTWYERLREMLAGAISEPTKQPDEERQFHIADLATARTAFDRYTRQSLQWDDPAAAVPPTDSQPPLRREDIFE